MTIISTSGYFYISFRQNTFTVARLEYEAMADIAAYSICTLEQMFKLFPIQRLPWEMEPINIMCSSCPFLC